MTNTRLGINSSSWEILIWCSTEKNECENLALDTLVNLFKDNLQKISDILTTNWDNLDDIFFLFLLVKIFREREKIRTKESCQKLIIKWLYKYNFFSLQNYNFSYHGCIGVLELTWIVVKWPWMVVLFPFKLGG